MQVFWHHLIGYELIEVLCDLLNLVQRVNVNQLAKLVVLLLRPVLPPFRGEAEVLSLHALQEFLVHLVERRIHFLILLGVRQLLGHHPVEHRL